LVHYGILCVVSLTAVDVVAGRLLAMTFDLSGRVVRWPDGSEGTIEQEDFNRDLSSGGRHAFVALLKVRRDGKSDITGGLRFTHEAHERMPGRDDVEKANAVGLKLFSWVAKNGLKDGFFFRVDANDFGVQIVEAAE
jgi:hypothetical protein